MPTVKKDPKLPKSPGMGEVVFGAVLSLTLGALLAATHLAAAPVEKVREMPEEPEEGKVYVVEGAANPLQATHLTRKKELVLEARKGDYAFSEDELNIWTREAIKMGVPEGELFSIRAGVPNFRVQNGSVQILTENELHLLGSQRPLVLWLTGSVSKGGSGATFDAREINLGRLPVHRLPAKLQALVLKRFYAENLLPEDIAAALSKSASVKATENRIEVKFQ